jgi:anti-anti-sigma factor
MSGGFSPGTVELLYEDVMTVVSLVVSMTCPRSRRSVRRSSAARPGRPLVVDLSPASLIGSTTLGAILYGSGEVATHGIRLVVVSPSESRPSKVLALTGMADQLLIVETLEGSRLLLQAGRTFDDPSDL